MGQDSAFQIRAAYLAMLRSTKNFPEGPRMFKTGLCVTAWPWHKLFGLSFAGCEVVFTFQLHQRRGLFPASRREVL